MSRRSLLLAYLVNSFKWLPYSYEYLYNSLIPETISGKEVKNKAKVSKIYANGVVENQIVQNGDFSLNSGWYAISSVYSFNISNNTMTATKTAIGANLFCYKSNDYVPLQPNHKYLCVAQCKASSNCRVRFCASVRGTTKTLSANTTTLLTDFITTGSSISGIYCGLQEVEESSFPTLPVGGTIKTREYRMFDLTLMFGTGNEPTTLTDNRIQAILNRGYIAYNTGTYKGTDIGVISTKDSNNTDLDTLTFKYQGNGALNSHDTFEITSSEYVFTKNNGSVDLGTLNWNYDATNQRFFTGVSGIKPAENTSILGNIICSKYDNSIFNEFYQDTTMNKKISIGTNPTISIRDTAYTDATTFKTAMGGVMLYYQLATPQVIRIPKKHLGIVKIRDLSWTYHSLGFCYASITGKKDFNNQNLYCSPFMLTDASVSTMPNLSMKAVSVLTQQNVAIKDTSISNTTDFVNKYGDYYIFYETENEVSDIADTIDIEKGGTITTDSEVLPNVDFNIKCK